MTKDEKLEYFDKLKQLNSIKNENIDSEWQNECLEKIKHSNNVILSSPTGSGKTSVFLKWALEKEQRPIYITSPIKALSNQRWRELQEQGFVVGLETGDIKNVPENCDFICCTQEIYTNKYIEEEDATLIIDEFHYIFENSKRARTYIDSLHNSNSKTNIECILKQLSSNRKLIDEDKIVEIEKLYKKYNIDNAENELLNYAKRGIAGYHGGLLPKEKFFVEECFEKRIIDTVVGTDALAMGVNFPIENVVFAQLDKMGKLISKNLFDQIAGRAGRKGYFDKGNVYFCDEFQLENSDYDLKSLYIHFLFAKNENATVYLQPNIQDILQGNTTIEEEAEFISRYSTDKPDLEQTIEKIIKKVEYIMDEDNYKNRIEGMLDYEFGYDDYDKKHKKVHIFESDSEEVCEKRENLLSLKDEFFENIPDAYFDEYSPKKNCRIFIDILNGKDVTQLKETHASDFNELLELRKYLELLPEKYRKNINIVQLEDEINEIDFIALNYGRGSLHVKDIGDNIREELLSSDGLKDALKHLEEDLGCEQPYSDKRDEIQEAQ